MIIRGRVAQLVGKGCTAIIQNKEGPINLGKIKEFLDRTPAELLDTPARLIVMCSDGEVEIEVNMDASNNQIDPALAEYQRFRTHVDEAKRCLARAENQTWSIVEWTGGDCAETLRHLVDALNNTAEAIALVLKQQLKKKGDL